MALISVFGLLPSTVVSAYIWVGFIVGPQKIVTGEYVVGLLLLGVSSLTLLGTYTLARLVLGTKLRLLRDGLTAGLVAMTLLVLNPILSIALDELGVLAARSTDGLPAFVLSLFCVTPMVVYAILAYQSWKLD